MTFKEALFEAVAALEKDYSHYDSLGRVISFNLPEKARTYAVDHANINHETLVLDAGIGPGEMLAVLYQAS